MSWLVCSLGLTACLAFCTTPSWDFRLEDLSGLFRVVFDASEDLESFYSLCRLIIIMNPCFATLPVSGRSELRVYLR